MAGIDIKRVQDTVHDNLDIDLTEEQAASLCTDSRVVSAFALGGFDTVTHETIADALTRRIVGRGWPLNGDGREAWARFVKDMCDKAPGLGYRLLDTFTHCPECRAMDE